MSLDIKPQTLFYKPVGVGTGIEEPSIPLHAIRHMPRLPPLPQNSPSSRVLTRRHSMPSLRKSNDCPDPLDVEVVKPIKVDPEKIKKNSKLGITPGGRYDFNSREYYVKKASSKPHLRSELMNEAIMRLAGYKTIVGRRIAEFSEGEFGLASPWNQDLHKIGSLKEGDQALELSKVRQAFAPIAALGIRDAVNRHDGNIMQCNNEQVFVDVGCGGLFGGTGTKRDPEKDFNAACDHLLTLRARRELKDESLRTVKIGGVFQQSNVKLDNNGFRIYEHPIIGNALQAVKLSKEAEIFENVTTSEFEHGARKFGAVSDAHFYLLAIQHGFTKMDAEHYIARKNKIVQISKTN